MATNLIGVCSNPDTCIVAKRKKRIDHLEAIFASWHIDATNEYQIGELGRMMALYESNWKILIKFCVKKP
jgi:hypothetical protein